MIYLAGSLRNPNIPVLREQIEYALGIPVFADWYAAGPTADDHWKEYYKEQCAGIPASAAYVWALQQPASINVYNFDKKHIDEAKLMVLALPAGKSGHLELGYFIGTGKPGIIYLEQGADPRWDVMYQFAADVAMDQDNLMMLIDAHYPRG